MRAGREAPCGASRVGPRERASSSISPVSTSPRLHISNVLRRLTTVTVASSLARVLSNSHQSPSFRRYPMRDDLILIFESRFGLVNLFSRSRRHHDDDIVTATSARSCMGFWFFGPFSWSWGGGRGERPRGRVVVFGAVLTLPLAAWNIWRWNQHSTQSSPKTTSPPSLPRTTDGDEARRSEPRCPDGKEVNA